MEDPKKPSVTWAGVIVRLSDGTIVATEFASGFITADVHTLKPWNGGRNPTQDEVRITVQGNGRLWTEGEVFTRRGVIAPPELEASELDPRIIEQVEESLRHPETFVRRERPRRKEIESD